ncbi:ribbon-helix-helix domain-containing protein [Dehalococcoidia bacterium]|nr:ribbon-helix-helix domain-containing protein [Dehalococcoidia bacterium]
MKERKTLEWLDRFVKNQAFPSRSRAVQESINQKLARLPHIRLAKECAKFDPAAEKAMAEEGLSQELNQ